MPLGLRLVVADSGPGISKEDCDRFFSRVFTAKSQKAPVWACGSAIHWLNAMVAKLPLKRTGKGTWFAVWLRLDPSVLVLRRLIQVSSLYKNAQAVRSGSVARSMLGRRCRRANFKQPICLRHRMQGW